MKANTTETVMEAQGDFTLLRIREMEQQVRAMRDATICALCQVLDARGLGLETTRFADWAVRLGRAFGLDTSTVQSLEVAALIHDIGRAGLPDALLRGSETGEEEKALMKAHAEQGFRILKSIPGLEQAALFVLHHHERFDGEGCPAGLVGEEIPLGARIVAVIDAFDRLVGTGPGRHAMPFEEAAERLAATSGSELDPGVVEAFLRIARTEWKADEALSEAV